MAENLKSLMSHFPKPGALEWIGLRTGKREPVTQLTAAELSTENGLTGDGLKDHYGGRSKKRQVTLIQAEHLAAMAGLLQIERVDPSQMRRNLVVSGLNLLALKNQQFQVGEAVLSFTGLCHPCSRMEEYFGPGGYNAVRGHGGINATVLKSGAINVGDSVTVLAEKDWL